jgi:hypothetical protein
LPEGGLLDLVKSDAAPSQCRLKTHVECLLLGALTPYV